jgi:alkanesulfonate monooxygenase SsuD/methylene tetrahydromethanopterin reductase-like flavin-dependent oxidoreductase (luciferase family)
MWVYDVGRCSTSMGTGALLPRIEGHEPADLAARIESWGYDSVWVSELWGESAIVVATEIATQTDSIGIGTAITNVFSRSPATLAMSAATIDRIAEGRFTLGVGTSTPKAIEDLHGMAFHRPVRRAHETISLIKAFTSGAGGVAYHGDLFEVADFPALEASIPVYHAALGPANRRVVGRLCDGWLPHNIPFTQLETAFEEVVTAAREAGRDPDAITVAPYVPAAVSSDPEEASAAIRGHIAYYVGSGEGYRRAVATRFPEATATVAEAWRAGERRAASEAVTEAMIDALGIHGTPETARADLNALVAETVVDRPLIVVPEQASELAVDTLGALAPVAGD